MWSNLNCFFSWTLIIPNFLFGALGRCVAKLPVVVSDAEIIWCKAEVLRTFCKDADRRLNVNSFANCGQPQNKELWALKRCHKTRRHNYPKCGQPHNKELWAQKCCHKTRRNNSPKCVQPHKKELWALKCYHKTRRHNYPKCGQPHNKELWALKCCHKRRRHNYPKCYLSVTHPVTFEPRSVLLRVLVRNDFNTYFKINFPALSFVTGWYYLRVLYPPVTPSGYSSSK
jgi:hypothetical protein